MKLMEEDLKDQYIGVLSWVLQNTAVSPCDCYVLLKSNQRYVQFQKKGTLTRKNLIKKLIADGIDALFIRKEEERFYIEFLERFLMTGFAAKKIASFLLQQNFHLLEFPNGIRIPANLKKKIIDSLPEEYIFDFMSAQAQTTSMTTEDVDQENRILEILYSDIGLGSDADGADDNKKRDEVVELMNEMSTLREENDQLRDRLKQIDEKEKEVRKAYDELYAAEGDKNHLLKVVDELQRKLKIAEGELEGYRSNGGEQSSRFQKQVESLEKRLEEQREDTKEFKLKYARELEETKKLKRELSEAQLRLNKTATALKKISNK